MTSPSTTVNLSKAQQLTNAQGATAYRLLARVAARYPNQPLAVGVADAATAVVSMNLGTAAQLSAQTQAPPAAAPPEQDGAAFSGTRSPPPKRTRRSGSWPRTSGSSSRPRPPVRPRLAAPTSGPTPERWA